MNRRSLLAGSLILAAPSVWAAPVKKPFPKPKLIALDPGHGGRDPGALGYRGTQEKGVVLAVARDLQRELLAGNRYRVMLTRTTDAYVPLRERVARATDAKADLFLSIHADSAGDQAGISGASVYTLSAKSSRQAAARFAVRENSADMVNGVRLADQDESVNAILVELSHSGAKLTPDELTSMQKRIDSKNLLFKMRVMSASMSPVCRAFACCSCGSLPARIEMKTMLSMPRMISSTVSVSKLTQASGCVNTLIQSNIMAAKVCGNAGKSTVTGKTDKNSNHSISRSAAVSRPSRSDPAPDSQSHITQHATRVTYLPPH